jgi:hypothetical protein
MSKHGLSPGLSTIRPVLPCLFPGLPVRCLPKMTGMKRFAIPLLFACLLAACARMNSTAMHLLSSIVPAYAVLNDITLNGTAELFADRSGTLSLESDQEPALKCRGRLQYTATRSGVIRLMCNDGNEALLNFTTLTETSGYGGGATSKGLARLAFGLDQTEALAYLKLPLSKPAAAEVPAGPQ